MASAGRALCLERIQLYVHFSLQTDILGPLAPLQYTPSTLHQNSKKKVKYTLYHFSANFGFKAVHCSSVLSFPAVINVGIVPHRAAAVLFISPPDLGFRGGWKSSFRFKCARLEVCTAFQRQCRFIQKCLCIVNMRSWTHHQGKQREINKLAMRFYKIHQNLRSSPLRREQTVEQALQNPARRNMSKAFYHLQAKAQAQPSCKKLRRTPMAKRCKCLTWLRDRFKIQRPSNHMNWFVGYDFRSAHGI